MTTKERVCRTCSFWDYVTLNENHTPGDGWSIDGKCHYENLSITKDEGDWCRHWSATTGWDRFEDLPTPLENGAALILEKVRESYPTFAGVQVWLEEYKRKC